MGHKARAKGTGRGIRRHRAYVAVVIKRYHLASDAIKWNYIKRAWLQPLRINTSKAQAVQFGKLGGLSLDHLFCFVL